VILTVLRYVSESGESFHVHEQQSLGGQHHACNSSYALGAGTLESRMNC
jgi:hypothetical protein